MKILRYIGLLACIGYAFGGELKKMEGAFGEGKHAVYDPTKPNEVQVVSRLDKNGRVFECVRVSPTELIIQEAMSDPDEENQTILTFTKETSVSAFGLEIRLVDVWIGVDELSFLFADSGGYGYVLAKKRQLTIPAGSFYLPPVSLNSAVWAVTLKMGANNLGYRIPGWSHFAVASSAALTGKNAFSIQPVDENEDADLFNVAVYELKKNNVVLPQALAYPLNQSVFKESVIISIFDSNKLAADQVIPQVEFFDGGKVSLFAVLNQFTNQAAATVIRNRVNQAYADAGQ